MSTLLDSLDDQPTASQNPSQAMKRKRNLPGNPDPDAEVLALSPKTLMATNRFLCEICNKGFQRDQNLQLHRRGHNLPWKLKQRANKDDAAAAVVRKKVYICPEVGCVHHSPSRALGDLTGIKKHFSRKHGEKKYKCDKCSKKYAVHSDCKAHAKTCGTREYKCDCGTIFSRRDSFITHRAFCDALAVESAKTIMRGPNPNNMIPINTASNINNPNPLIFSPGSPLPSMLIMRSHAECNTAADDDHHPSFTIDNDQLINMRNTKTSTWPSADHDHLMTSLNHHHLVASSHLSATALLQKATEMGASISNHSTTTMITTSSSGLGLFDPYAQPPPLVQEMMMMSSMSNAVQCSTGNDGISRMHGVLNSNKIPSSQVKVDDDYEMTRDFLGVEALSAHKDLLGLKMDPCMGGRPPSFDGSQQS